MAARFYAARNFETIAHAYLRSARYCYLRAIAAPFIVASPGYFFGGLSLGSLMVAVGAFNQVQQALRWFVDNFSTVADWRATLLRVASFRLALVEMDKLGGETGRIELVPTADDRLVFDQIGIASPDGCTMLGEKHVMINPGERVLIIGKRQGGKTSFFSAIAGLWPWGCGRILLPPAQTMMFISQQDYMPPGTLRDALAYPSQPSQFASEKYIAALERMKLAHLSPHLDRVARWEQEDLPCSRPYRLFRKVMRSTSLGVEPTRGAGPG